MEVIRRNRYRWYIWYERHIIDEISFKKFDEIY